MGDIIRLLIVVVAASTVACSPKDFSGRTAPTPINNNQVGIVVLAGDSDDKKAFFQDVKDIMQKYPDAKIRVVNLQYNLYEFHGINKQVLIDKFPNAIIAPNKVVKVEQLSKPKRPRHPLAMCKNIDIDSEIEISIGNPSKINESHKVGDHISISAEISSAAFIQVQAPAGSNNIGILKESTSLNLIPDMVGIHTVRFFKIDKLKKCTTNSITLLITDNPNIKTLPNHSPFNIDKFHHLEVIQAHDALKISTGKGVKIAIIDTGVNYNHPSLNQNIAFNHGEIPGNFIDDDGNGFVDDYFGYDFVNNDPFAFDDDGHGTHVAGLAASSDFGVAPSAKIIPIKAMSGHGTGDMASTAGALLYAIQLNADIINLSLSSYNGSHPAIIKALKLAFAKNIIVVSAVGNGMNGVGFNMEKTTVYPAMTPLENIISVGAFAKDELITSYSNYNSNFLDVLAPGGNVDQPILSAYVQNPRGRLLAPSIGTSMATPIVAGIAALVKSHKPNLSATQIRQILMSAGEHKPELKSFVGSSKHINALHALELTLPIVNIGFNNN